MESIFRYELIIIGGGISACVFASNYLQNNPRSKIALIEAGRSLGGRSSTRISRSFRGWELNHGSPNINIFNSKKNLLLQNYIDHLLENKFIKNDDSEYVQIYKKLNLDIINNFQFLNGHNYISLFSMSELSQNIIGFKNLRNQIDFYFNTLIFDLSFDNNEWNLTSKNGYKFKSNYLICSSNLLLHKRSLKILGTSEIPLRKAIPANKNKKIDSLLNLLNQQIFIPRLTFMIYTTQNYSYRDFYTKKYRYCYLDKVLENKYEFERVIFQRQNIDRLGIVIHTRSKNLIDSYLNEKNEIIFKQKIIRRFNSLFENNSSINYLIGNENISIMKWRASQPSGVAIPLHLQFCRINRIGFCGDWFDGEGFGRIEGAILSALMLAEKFKTLN